MKNIIPFMLGVVCAMLIVLLVLLYQMQGPAMFQNWGVWLLIAMVAVRLTRSLLLIKQYVRPAVLVLVLASASLSLTSCGTYTMRCKTNAGNVVQLNTSDLTIDLITGDKIAAVRIGTQYMPLGAGSAILHHAVDTLTVVE